MANYDRVNWEDAPSKETPLNAENLNSMDAGIEAVDEAVENVAARVSSFDDRMDLLDARMDTLVAVPPGSTAGNTELIDIRAGVDGTTYSSAGSAVRGQIGDLNNAVDAIEDDIDDILTMIVPVFSPGVYNKGDLVRYENELYECITKTTSSAEWDSTKWRSINLASLNRYLHDYIAKPYASGGTVQLYDAGALCFYDHKLYRSLEAMSVLPSTPFDSTKWEQVSVGRILTDLSENVVDLQADVTYAKATLVNLTQLIVDETTTNKETKVIPSIPSTLPTNWNTGQPYYYLSDRVIPEGALIKSVKIGTNVANTGSIVFVNDDNVVVYKYSASCVTGEWNVFEIGAVANEDLRIAVYARASWMISGVTADNAFASNGLWLSDQLTADVGDTMTFAQGSSSLYELAIQWEIETGERVSDTVSTLVDDVEDLQDDVATAKDDLVDLKQLVIDETTASSKVTKLIPNIPSTLPTNWNTGQDYYYVSDRVIPKGALIKSVKIGTNVANDGSIIFVNDDNIVVYKYSASCVTNEWNVFEIDAAANEDLRIAVRARASWMIAGATPDNAFSSDGLWRSSQVNADVGDTMTFTGGGTTLYEMAIQWEIEVNEHIKNLVDALMEDSEEVKEDVAALNDDILDLNKLIIDETTVTTGTKLIPSIPSALPTNWNAGQSYCYVSDRVIPKGSVVKSVKIATKVANNGAIIFVNDDNVVVYKHPAVCVTDEWNVFELDLVATEDLRIAVSARPSWMMAGVTADNAFASNGLWASSQLNPNVGDTMTFTQSSTSLFELAVQWEIELKAELKDLIPDLISDVKSERPVSGYENFSVSVNYSDYTSNGNDGVSSYVDYGVIGLPDTYRNTGTPTQLIILCGGSGERIGSNTNPLSYNGWPYYLAKGYAVMDMNGVSTAWASAKGVPNTGLHYCNKFLLESYSKGYEYVTKKYNVTKSVFIAGISMGGGAAALITQSNIIPVIANAFFCPALSVYKQDYMSPWGGTNQQITIAGQWDFPDWATTTPSQAYFLENIEKIKGFDNLLIRTIGDHQTANANFGNEAEANAYNSMQKAYPVPIKIWHCENDALVPFRYSQFMVNMIKNGGGQAWLRSYATGGHVGGWDTGEVTDAGVTTSIPFYESILFFKRFG